MSAEMGPPQECFIEIRGVYDGWSVKKEVDGTLVNRWPPDDRRYKPTQDWIDRMKSRYSKESET